jgi:hypothetical protein
LPHQFFLSTSCEEEYYENEADEGLGYYSDGAKRTLTDTQISIFRHSEIQRILRREAGDFAGPIFPTPFKQKEVKTHVHSKDRVREKRAAKRAVKAENKARKAGTLEARKAATATTEVYDAEQADSPALSTQSAPGMMKKMKRNKKVDTGLVARDDARGWKPPEPVRSTSTKRRNTSSPEPELKRAPKKAKQDTAPKNVELEAGELEDRHDPEDYMAEGEEFTYRRLARDEDDVPNVSVELDY